MTDFGGIQAYTLKPSGQGVRLTASGHFKEFTLIAQKKHMISVPISTPHGLQSP